MRLGLFFLCVSAWATTTVQQPIRVSAQQALIQVHTDQVGNCTYIVSAAVGLSPAVDDNSNALFTGANSDARGGSILSGRDHYYVAGTRTGAAGSDGLIHSRSLAPNTQYFGSVTCGGDMAVTFSFTTLTIAFGSVYAESPPFSSSGFGNYAWPTLSWTDATKTYNDPMTGLVLQRMTGPGDYSQIWSPRGGQDGNFTLVTGGTGWTNPTRLNNGLTCDGTGALCAVAGNTNKTFLFVDGTKFVTDAGATQPGGYKATYSMDDFIVFVRGIASTAGSNHDKVNICLSYYDSGVTCDSATQSVTMPTSVGTVGFPASNVGVGGWAPQFQFGEWGGTAPLRGDFAGYYGTVTVSGGTNVTLASPSIYIPDYFNVKWNNAFIYIAGSGCTDGGTDVCKISGHPTDPEHLTLQNASANVTAAYKSMASGVVVWKQDATGTVTIGASYDFAFSAMFALPQEGDFSLCNPNSVSVGYQADGSTVINPALTGYLCFIPDKDLTQGGILKLLVPSTGEVRLLSHLFTPPWVNSGDASADRNFTQIAFAANPWGNTGTVFYGISTCGLAGATTCLFSATYDVTQHFKSYAHPLYGCGICAGLGGANALPGQDPTVSFPYGRWSDDPIIYANLTKPSHAPPLDIYAQMASNNTQYDTNIFSVCGLVRILNGHAVMSCGPGGEQMAIFTIFDLSTGLATSSGDSFSTYPARWCGKHTDFQSTVSPGYYALTCNPTGTTFTGNAAIPLNGPWQFTPYSMYKSGSFNIDTSMTPSSPMDTCPANAYGIFGNTCVTIHTQDVCSHTPTAAELAKWPCSQNGALMVSWSQVTGLAAGDGLILPNNENDQVLSVNPVTDAGCGTGCKVVVLARGQWQQYPKPHATQTVTNNWTGYAIPPYGNCDYGSCRAGVGVWIPLNATGNLNTQWISDPSAFGGHSDQGTAPTTGNTTFVQSSILNTPYSLRYNQTFLGQAGNYATNAQISSNGPFAGATSFGCDYQSYPSLQQYNATTNEKRWFLDFHHCNGGLGIDAGEYLAGLTNDTVTYTLVGGTTTVYDFSAIAGSLTVNLANYKTHPVGGYAGKNLFQDISNSSTGSDIITDATPWKFCVALRSGECRNTSGAGVAGHVYTSVPNVPNAPKTFCYTDWLTENYPCIWFSATGAGWLVQMDASQQYANYEYGRRLTMGLTGWGRQYQFNTHLADPTGTYSFFKADWADGIYSPLMMAKLPPFDAILSTPHYGFVNVPVSFGSGSTYAEVQFGYAENGSIASYYCTSRAEACNTSGSPYSFELDSRSLTSCTSGCTIQVPAISGRVLYYRPRRSSDGTNWTNGPPAAILVP